MHLPVHILVYAGKYECVIDNIFHVACLLFCNPLMFSVDRSDVFLIDLTGIYHELWSGIPSKPLP